MAAVAKTRSRKDGAAVPLDETDKRLLNLLQGSFPLAERPYAEVARLAELSEDETLRRTRRLLDERIIREVTPIFDTRVLGYSSMLVAAKVDPEHPWRAAKIINSHPGVSHNYLRDHDFNLWFTIATEPGSKLGARRHARRARGPDRGGVGAPAADAAPVQDPHGPRDGEGHRHARRGRRGGRPQGARGDRAVRPRRRRDQGDPGPDGADRRAVRPRRRASSACRCGALLEHLESMRERRALRRVAAILFHRRAGFSANGMGVWKVPEERILELGPRMASFRGISHCYQRPTYADWPYSVFTMAHGRSKEECDAILDSIAADTGIEERRTLYSSTEFKKIRMLYFTGAHAEWEAQYT